MLEPEVAGGLGQKAVLDHSVSPPRVTRFHYEFDGWLGDPLLETVAFFIVTDQLKRGILDLAATGVSFAKVEISKSGEFEDFFPNRQLPHFAWLQVIGKAGQDDFGLSASHRLVVSQRVLDLLRQTGMSHCDIAEFNG
jgi:hypothetical protein